MSAPAPRRAGPWANGTRSTRVDVRRNGREPDAGEAPGALGGLDVWLPRGVGLRPWAAVMGAGVAVLGLGLAMLVTNLYRIYIVPESGTTLLYLLTLQFIPHPWREVLVGLVGVALVIRGWIGVAQALRRAAARG